MCFANKASPSIMDKKQPKKLVEVFTFFSFISL